MRTRRKSGFSRSGFTLAEVVVGLTLTSIVLGSVGMAARRGLGLFERSSANSEITARSGRAIDRIAKELLGADRSDLTPFPVLPFGSSTIDFKTATAWAGGGIVWSPVRRIALQLAQGELNNGADDNGNGLVDEGAVVLVENPGQADERRIEIVTGVSELLAGETLNAADDNGNGLRDEAGLSFVLVGDVLTIRLSIEHMGPDGQLMVRTQQASIMLRNES